MSDISNSGLIPASNAIRNRNKKAIARRNAWRAKYRELAELIRISKRNLAATRNSAGKDTIVILSSQIPDTDFVLDMTLRDLQVYATDMMEAQKKIKAELRATAYPWV